MYKDRLIFTRRAWLFMATAFIIGCAAVGPDYEAPPDTAAAAWHTGLSRGETPASAVTQALARWWDNLDDPVLSEVMQQALAGNLDLKSAAARIQEARAARGISGAARFPTLDLAAGATRSRSSENTGGGKVRDLYTAGFDAGWELDVFGGVRRSLEAAEADVQASMADLDDVLVTLTAEVGLNYVEARTFQARLAVADANLAVQEETFDLIQARYAAGLSNELALQQARYNLESTRSQIPGLQTGLAAAQNRLAVLTGRNPGRLHRQLAEPRPVPVIPPAVAVGVPAETLRRRPDVRRAERQLAASTARIGVATADLYPKFHLAGSIGLESLQRAEWFKSSSRFWNFGPGVSWRIFDAGAIRNNIKTREALQQQALIAYEATVLGALEEVENALGAYAQEQLRRERLMDAVAAARRAAQLSRDQYTAGLIDFSNVLDAQRSLLSFQDQLAQSDGTVTSNLVRLYKALGGGWQPLEPAGRQ